MANIKESGLAKVVENNEVWRFIENPSRELIRRAFCEIPIIPVKVDVGFSSNGFPFPHLEAKFESFGGNGVFKLRNNIEVCAIEGEEKVVREMLLRGKKPDTVIYIGDKCGFETLKNGELDSVIKAGYTINSFDLTLISHKKSTLFFWNSLKLRIDENDNFLSANDKNKLTSWFETLKEPQQK